jgi:HEAT repeat protein
MPLFGPPDVEKLKAKRDIRGLHKATLHKDFSVVVDAVYALAALGVYVPHAAGPGVSSTDPEVRKKAYSMITTMKTGGFISAIGAIHDRNESVRLIGIMAFLALGDMRMVSPLIKSLHSDDSDNVRQSAAIVLGKIGDKRSVDALIEARNDNSPAVRKSVKEALDRLGNNNQAQ